MSIGISKIDINPGEVRLVKVDDPNLGAELSGVNCNGKKFLAFEENGQIVFYLSESYFSDKSPYSCHRLPDETTIVNVKVGHIEYPSEKLRVNKKRVTLSKKNLKRVQSEQVVLNKIYRSSINRQHFSREFRLPLHSKVTSIYGTRRIFNNHKKTQHLGTDFRAAIGTRIVSANNGKVVLAGDLFYTGNTVIIDHGMGIFTVYGHLESVNVSTNDQVLKGDIIGLSGRTGRVTGPHLHWGVKINGEYIEGRSLIRETTKI